jgi:hypothetical protein
MQEKIMEEDIDDILDKRHPRVYGWKRAIVWIIIASVSLFVTLLVIAALLSSCKPLVTSAHGYVILTDSHQIAVEHKDMNRPDTGIIRYYQFPFGHTYEIGDCVTLKKPSNQDRPSGSEGMADKNN